MRKYTQAIGAVQAGVKLLIEKLGLDRAASSPAKLRTGLNGIMCDHAALAELLIAKGVITHEEYMAAITKKMNDEVDRYEKDVSEAFGGKTKITLHSLGE